MLDGWMDGDGTCEQIDGKGDVCCSGKSPFSGFQKNVKGLILVDTTCKLYIIPGNLLE